jgi:hypothetical protein
VILDSSGAFPFLKVVLDAWADYFEDLATPSEQQSFDSTFLALVNDDVDILTEIFTKYRQPMQEVTEEELSECISTFQYQFSMCLEFLHFEKLCLLILSI